MCNIMSCNYRHFPNCLPFRQAKTAGNISASTTISAKSTECLAIWLNAENMCRCKKTKGASYEPQYSDVTR